MKQYIDLMTPMEAYQKGYEKGQEDVVTIPASTIYDNGVMQGRKEVVDWGLETCPHDLFGKLLRIGSFFCLAVTDKP